MKTIEQIAELLAPEIKTNNAAIGETNRRLVLIGDGSGKVRPDNPVQPREVFYRSSLDQNDRGIALLSTTCPISIDALDGYESTECWLANIPGTSYPCIIDIADVGGETTNGATPQDGMIRDAAFTPQERMRLMLLSPSLSGELSIYVDVGDNAIAYNDGLNSGFITSQDVDLSDPTNAVIYDPTTTALASGEHRILGVAFSATDDRFVCIPGTAVAASDTLPQRSDFEQADYEAIDFLDYYRCGYLYNYFGQTEFDEDDCLRIFDPRLIIGNVPTSGAPGSGDVSGPTSSDDNAIVRFDGATGKIIQNSAWKLADNVTGFFGSFIHANSANRDYTFPNATGTVALINSTGQGFVVTAPGSSADNIVQPSGNYKAFIVKNNASQAVNIFEHQDSSSNVLASINSSGELTAVKLNALSNDGTTGAVVNVATFTHNTTGTGGAGIGTSVTLASETSTTPDTVIATINASFPVATHASRTARVTFNLTDNAATRTVLQLDANGSAGSATVNGNLQATSINTTPIGTTTPSTIVGTTIRAANGSLSAPGFAFSSFTNTGFYHDGTAGDGMWLAAQGINVFNFRAGGNYTLTHIFPNLDNTLTLGDFNLNFQRVYATQFAPKIGSVSSPSYTIMDAFGNQMGTGMYGSGTLGAALLHFGTNSTNAMTIDTAQNIGIGKSTSIGARLHILTTDAATNTVTNVAILGHNGGSVAAGFGTGLLIQGESSTTNDTSMAQIAASYIVATHASRTVQLDDSVIDSAATRIVLRRIADGSRGYASVLAGTQTGTRATLGGVIFDHFVDSSVGGAEADIYTDTLPASTLATNGDKVTASYGGNFVTLGTETVQLKAYFGGTAIWDSTGVAVTTGTTSWRIYVEIIRVSATVIRYTVSLSTTGASGFVYAVSGELTGLTLSNTNVIKITGFSSGVGSGTGDIVGKMGYVQWQSAVG